MHTFTGFTFENFRAAKIQGDNESRIQGKVICSSRWKNTFAARAITERFKNEKVR